VSNDRTTITMHCRGASCVPNGKRPGLVALRVVGRVRGRKVDYVSDSIRVVANRSAERYKGQRKRYY